MPFDDIFSELEEANTEQQEFMDFFHKIIPGLPLVVVLADGAEILQEGDGFPVINDLGAILEELRQCEGQPVWDVAQELGVGGVYLSELSGAVLWLDRISAQGEESRRILLDVALRSTKANMEQQKVSVENEQLQRQIEALKKQHGELVESNHHQYLLIQEKEKGYAKKLETEITARTAELRKTNEDLVKASRLKSEFLANMSHELRTPMNAIIGFSELLVETNLDPVQADYAVTITQSGAGLLTLINDILDFAKIEADKLDINPYPFEIGSVVKNVQAMFEKPASLKGVVLVCRVDKALPETVLGDGNRIKQVLVNLFGNAMKFTESGEIAVFVEMLGHQNGKVKIKFSVRDSGIGIAKERQDAIFQEFVQEDGSTTRRFGGTGLGLSISTKLVSLMGGDLSLESEIGKGSIFSFSLELPEAEKDPGVVGEITSVPKVKEVASSAVLPEQEDGAGRVKPLVLLVEDNLVNQKLASVLIKRQGCEVTVAADGLIALEKLREQRFDLVLMDLQMPNMGGLEATRKIREIEQGDESQDYKGLQEKQSPILIVGLSAHARKDDAQEGIDAGMNDFMTKPIVRAKLEAVLKRIIE